MYCSWIVEEDKLLRGMLKKALYCLWLSFVPVLGCTMLGRPNDMKDQKRNTKSLSPFLASTDCNPLWRPTPKSYEITANCFGQAVFGIREASLAVEVEWWSCWCLPTLYSEMPISLSWQMLEQHNCLDGQIYTDTWQEVTDLLWSVRHFELSVTPDA